MTKVCHPEPKARDLGTVGRRDPSLPPPSAAQHLHAQPQRTAEHRGARLGAARRAIGGDHEQRGVALAREVREPHRERPRQRRRAIEHQERERAAPQDHVRAPRRTRGILRAHHPQPLVQPEMCPVARGEGARRIDVRHPLAATECRLDDPPRDRRLAAAPAPACADDLREPPARQPARGHHGIQLRDARRHTRLLRVRRSESRGELLLQSGQRHEKAEVIENLESSRSG